MRLFEEGGMPMYESEIHDALHRMLTRITGKPVSERSVCDFALGFIKWGTEKGIINPASCQGLGWDGECLNEYGYTDLAAIKKYVLEYGHNLWKRLKAAESAGPLDEYVISPEGKTVDGYIAELIALPLPQESPADAPVEVGRQREGVFLLARRGSDYLYRWNGGFGILTKHGNRVSTSTVGDEGTDISRADMGGVRWVAQYSRQDKRDIYVQFTGKSGWVGEKEILCHFAEDCI